MAVKGNLNKITHGGSTEVESIKNLNIDIPKSDNNLSLQQTIASSDATFVIKGNYGARVKNTAGINHMIGKGFSPSGDGTNGIKFESGSNGKSSSNFGGKGQSYGKRSFVANSSNVSYGDNSFSAGNYNMSIGNTSTTVGAVNVALANYSFAGGYGSLTEGQIGFTYGEGCSASNYGSRAFGGITEANGMWSCSSGIHTKANGNVQTVIGVANKVDYTKALVIGNGKLASEGASVTSEASGLIHLGNENGAYVEADIARSNAFTVDWNGNTWMAGDLTFNYGGKSYTLSSLLNRIATLEAKV